MKVIFTNDDLGLSFGFTKAIEECKNKGLTTSGSILLKGGAYGYTKKILAGRLKRIGLGLHLNLTDGPSSEKSLSNYLGRFKYSFFDYLLLTLINPNLLKGIRKELESQFNQAVNIDELPIDHVDSEKHVHMIPPIFRVVCELCQQYKIKSIRFVKEPFFITGDLKQDFKMLFNLNLFKHLLLNHLAKKCQKMLFFYGPKTTDAFYGLLYSDNVTVQVIKSTILNAKKNHFNVIEISGHPAFIENSRNHQYLSRSFKYYQNSKNRLVEKEAFLDKDKLISNLMKKVRATASTFKDI